MALFWTYNNHASGIHQVRWWVSYEVRESVCESASVMNAFVVCDPFCPKIFKQRFGGNNLVIDHNKFNNGDINIISHLTYVAWLYTGWCQLPW